MRRIFAAAVSIIVLTGLLTGCTASAHEARGTSIQVNSSENTVLRAPTGLTVSIPAGATSGDGKLTVTRSTEDGIGGWVIKLSGAKLTGKATLTFAGAHSPREPAPLVGYTENPNSPLAPVKGVSLTASGATVTTTHFSFWAVDWWSGIEKQLTATWNRIFSPDASGTKPSCDGEDAIRNARYTVTSSTDNRIYWCMGTGGSTTQPQLTIVNARGYPVMVQESDNMVLANPDNSLESLLPQLMAQLGQLTLPAGDSMHLLEGNGTYTYNDTGNSPQSLRISENSLAYAAGVLEYGVDTVITLGSIFGTKPAKDILTAIESADCIPGLKTMATANVDSSTKAAKYLSGSLHVISSCLGGVITEVYSDDGVVASVILSGIAWLMSGIEDVATGVKAAADLVVYPNPYVITVTPPAAPIVSAADLMTITAPAMCDRPAGQLVNGELPVSDPDDNGYTEIEGIEQHQPKYATGTTSTFPSGIAAVDFDCSIGGVDWPQVIGLYNNSLNLIGSIDLGTLDQTEHANVKTMTFTDGALTVTWNINDTCHTGADVAIPRSADFAINSDGSTTISNSSTGAAQGPCIDQ